MSPKHQPADVRRAQILEAAASVCAERGYHATRIDDIAARAGLSKGAVYHHFPSKQEIFIAVAEEMMAAFVAQLQAAVEVGAGVAETLRGTVDSATEILAEENLNAAMLDLYVVAIRDDEFLVRFTRIYRQLIEVCAELFRRGIATGELRQLDAELAASSYLMSLDGLFLGHMLVDREPDQFRRRLEVFIEMILSGLLSTSREDS